MNKITRVYVLYTGGTFGMAPDLDKPGEPLRALALRELRTELDQISSAFERLHIIVESLDRPLDSAAIVPADWAQIAQRIENNYSSFDGFVVIHGTDTLAYTASALSFMFHGLAKPVVMTGAQMPLLAEGSDARQNIELALRVAGHKAFDLPHIPEVVIAFGTKILRGCRATKVSANRFDAFDSANYPPLGEVTAAGETRIYENFVRPAPLPDDKVSVDVRINPNVIDIVVHPGLRPDHLKAMLEMPGVSGAILRAYGAGTMPDGKAFCDALIDGLTGGKLAVAVTQCNHGTIDFTTYASSGGLVEAGVISGGDMTPEAALTKLMVLLGSYEGGRLSKEMLIDWRGEQT